MKPPKTRNSNTWTEARFSSFIKSLLRKGSMRWEPINQTKKAAWVERGKYRCNKCKQVVSLTLDGKKNVFVDHVIPASDPVEGFTSWDDFIYGLFCEADNLQVLCKQCHDKKSEEEGKLRRKHKDWPSLSPEYNSWRSMRARCLFPSHDAYDRYGGRGITICKDWVESFDNFLSDMGPRPEGKTLDRIDVDKGYFKENCRWSDPIEQANNRRNSVYLEFDGEKKTIAQWSKDLGIPVSTIQNRLAAGYSDSEVLASDFKRVDQVRSKMSEGEFIKHFSESKDLEDLIARTGRKRSTCLTRLQKLGLKFD